MKNTRSKKSFAKYTKRNTHKRIAKERSKEALIRAINELGVGTDALKLSYSSDSGRRGRISEKNRGDELLIRGVFSSSKAGFGFVTPTDDKYEKDIFIPEDRTGSAIDGDLVEIAFHEYTNRYGETKTEGRVRKIVAYGRKTLIGTVTLDEYGFRQRRRASRNYILVPDDSKITLRPVIRELLDAKEGDKVEAKIERTGAYPIECSIIKNFGNTYSRAANYEAILSECEIDTDFTPEEIAEAEFFASLPISEEGRVRRDREIIFTIDGSGAKDLDDAISLKKLPGGSWQLGVHIADVSHYVRERTHLDRAAMSRGTSVYFTDKVVPMLPKSLSNGACSLNPGEEKYTLSVVIKLSPSAEILETRIEPSIIKSRVRGVYSEVNAIFEGNASPDIEKKYKEVSQTLFKMRELYRILKKRSKARGALELETGEAEILLDENGAPKEIIRCARGEAEELIEQFMLVANEAVATLLTEKIIPCVYRIHEPPAPEKLSEFVTFAHNLGFDTSHISKEKSTSLDFSALLSEAEERGILAPVSYTMLRSMSKAKYSESRRAHFGLGINTYCHFTSPIRRLSDLATHRIIHRVLFEGKRAEAYSAYARRAAAAATEAELRAVSAERKIENLYKTIYMEGFVGQEFEAVINSVKSFGFFVELENTCEGLVPVEEMLGMFIFDEKNLTLRQRDKVYRIGDRVRVRLEECDVIRGKLRFSLA